MEPFVGLDDTGTRGTPAAETPLISRALRNSMGGGLLVAITLLLLYLLANASNNTSPLAHYYLLLVGLNGAIGVMLMVVLGKQALELRRRIHNREFGATLSRQIAVMFITVTLVPGLLVYTASLRFLNRSIETWFNVKVDKALDRSVDLGVTAFDHAQNELLQQARLLSSRIVYHSDTDIWLLLEEVRTQIGAKEATLFSDTGQVIHTSGQRPELIPMLLDNKKLNELRTAQQYQATESQPGGMVIRVIAPVYPQSLHDPIRWLQLVKPVPAQLVADAELVEQVKAEYKQLAESREGLKLYYTITLTLTLVIVLSGAMVLALFLSRRLSEPLSGLAAGARAVAQGDFSHRQQVRGHDELGMLAHLFNRMTRQLAETRDSLEQNRAQAEGARTYLETILGNIASGVLAFDHERRLRTFNPAAGHLLGVDCSLLVGRRFGLWAEQGEGLAMLGDSLTRHLASRESWEDQLDYHGPQRMLTLLLHGAPLPGETGGYVVLFDDITDLIQAQRTAAWGEVAKRLAHEIRNPLTPIQLSAERLHMKLADKLPEKEAELLERNTRTIVNQVAALKAMVDAFRDYAKAPSIQRTEFDLNALVKETLTLYESQRGLRLDLTRVTLTISADANGVRQVVHNLLRNAQDAVSGQENPEICVRTRQQNEMAVLSVEDNGSGFEDYLVDRVFEPYVTTKPKGTGLGLAVIKKIIDEHRGHIEVGNREPQGAWIRTEWPLTKPAQS